MFFKKKNKEDSKEVENKYYVERQLASFDLKEGELIFNVYLEDDYDYRMPEELRDMDTVKIHLEDVYCYRKFSIIAIIKESTFDEIDTIIFDKQKEMYEYRNIIIKEYCPGKTAWKLKIAKKVDTYKINTISIYDKLPYGLIETKEEYDEYCDSKLDYKDWCRKKLINKMLELNLGNGFIENFADSIDDDIKKI